MPMQQVGHSAHNMPTATYHHQGTQLAGDIKYFPPEAQHDWTHAGPAARSREEMIHKIQTSPVNIKIMPGLERIMGTGK